MKKKKTPKKKVKANRLYRRISNLAPKGFIEWLKAKMILAGIEKDPREKTGEWIGVSFLFALVPLLYYILIYVGEGIVWGMNEIIIGLVVFVGMFCVAIILFYLQIYYRMRNRTIEMEKILPDFLLLIVSNLRAGMTPWESFTKASRPEFGALHVEVKKTSSMATGESSLSDALENLSHRFDSKVLERTVKLFEKGARAGGRTAQLLIASAEEIRAIQDMRQELITVTRNYAIFLGFIVVFLMPFLLAVSTHFIYVFTEIHAKTTASTQGFSVGGAVMLGGNIQITEAEMIMLSVATLALTSILISLLTGIIGSGKALDGVKYAPVFAMASIVLYLLSKNLLTSMMSQFT